MPVEIGEQFNGGYYKQAQICKFGYESVGIGEQSDGIGEDSCHKIAAHQQAEGKQQIIAGKEILFAGPVDGVHLHDGIRIQGEGRFLLVIEHLHLMPGTGQIHAGMGAEVMEVLLLCIGARMAPLRLILLIL